MQLYGCFMSQSREFCRYNPLCCFSTGVCCCWLCYRLSPETFWYISLRIQFWCSEYSEWV